MFLGVLVTKLGVCGGHFSQVAQNKLVGTVPACLASRPDLQYLVAGYNDLEGTIPDEFRPGSNMWTL